MQKRGWVVLAIIIIAIIILAGLARNALVGNLPSRSDNVVLDEVYTLTTGSQIDDGLVVLSNVVALEAGSTIQGDVSLVVGSETTISGIINGNLTVMGDVMHLNPESIIVGNLTFIGSDVTLAGTVGGQVEIISDRLVFQETFNWVDAVPASVYACAEIYDATGDIFVRPCGESAFADQKTRVAELLSPITLQIGDISLLVGFHLLISTLSSLVLAGLSTLVVVTFPRQVSHIEEALHTHPITQGITGLLAVLGVIGITFTVVILLSDIPALGIFALFIYLLGLVALGIMLIFGWATATLMIGDVLLRRFTKLSFPPFIVTALGNLILIALWNLLGLTLQTGIVALALAVLIGTFGLGAVINTRLGTRASYQSHLVQG